MKNLAGALNCNCDIESELRHANIPKFKIDFENYSEVPYTIYGKIGYWIFKRAWNYWVVEVSDEVEGLILSKALKLHNKPLPNGNGIFGNIVRCGGHCAGLSPDVFGSHPIFNENFSIACSDINLDYLALTNTEINSLIKSNKLNVERYVNTYHVDDIIGLVELAKVLMIDSNEKYGYNKTYIIRNDDDEQFINNLIGLASTELSLVRKGLKECVDKELIANWVLNNI